jgi:hypothetical protein
VTEKVGKLTVIGQKQQAGRIHIQPTDGEESDLGWVLYQLNC